MTENIKAAVNSNISLVKFDEDFSSFSAKEELDLNRFRLDYNKVVSKAPEVLSIKGANFGSLGNISLIIGKAKSRKTFFSTLLMAAALRPADDQLGVFEHSFPENKKRVVFIDTEQSEYDAWMVMKRIYRLNNTKNQSNFTAFSLRSASVYERVEIVERILQEYNDVGLLVIDGIRDLVSAINDEKEASFIVNKLMKWSTNYGIHINVVLHQNKGDANARGHLGTELQNKAETTLSISLDKDKLKSIVCAVYCRQEEPTPFAFFINKEGLPEVLEGYQHSSAQRNKSKKLSPESVDKKAHLRLLKKVFGNEKDQKLKYSAAIDLLKEAGIIEFNNFGDAKAKAFFAYYQNKNWVQKIGTARSPSTYYMIDLEKLKAQMLDS